jgi:hypothetical protein
MFQTRIEKSDGWWVFSAGFRFILILLISLLIAGLITIIAIIIIFFLPILDLFLELGISFNYIRFLIIIYIVAYIFSILILYIYWRKEETIQFICPKNEIKTIVLNIGRMLNDKDLIANIVERNRTQHYIQFKLPEVGCYLNFSFYTKLQPPQTLSIGILPYKKGIENELAMIKMIILSYMKENNYLVYREHPRLERYY